MKTHINVIGSACGTFTEYQWLVVNGQTFIAQGFSKTIEQAQQCANSVINTLSPITAEVNYYGYKITVRKHGDRFMWSYVSKHGGNTDGLENTQGAAICRAKQSIFDYEIQRTQHEYSECLVSFNNKIFESIAVAEEHGGLTVTLNFTAALDNNDALNIVRSVLADSDMTYGVINSDCVFFDIQQTILLDGETLRQHIETAWSK